MNFPIPTVAPQEIAPETFLIPQLTAPAEGVFIPVSSLLIRGAEPVIVDTGAPIHRDEWLDKVFSLVDPEDVRWIFLSHDDGDHIGALPQVLDRCPNATLIGNFFIAERLGLEFELPLERMRWLQPGESWDAGDRTLHLFKPPVFDSPTTRGLYDSSTSAMWIVDSFASMITGEEALCDARDIPRDLYDETFTLFNSLISPWHAWLDVAAYSRHVDEIEAIGATVIASAHGGVHTGAAVGEAFDRVRSMAGQPILPGPGQETLDEIINGILAGATV